MTKQRRSTSRWWITRIVFWTPVILVGVCLLEVIVWLTWEHPLEVLLGVGGAGLGVVWAICAAQVIMDWLERH